MPILVIKCPNCGGPMWEEELLDSRGVIDLACIICGKREFRDKAKYNKIKKKIESAYYGNQATSRGVVRPQ